MATRPPVTQPGLPVSARHQRRTLGMSGLAPVGGRPQLGTVPVASPLDRLVNNQSFKKNRRELIFLGLKDALNL